MRITSAANSDANAELQCYVDDPVLTVGGTEEQRLRIMIRTILLWLVLGLKLAWRKGQRGNTGEWVGAYFRPWTETATRGVVIGITKARAAQLGQKCRLLLRMGDTIPKPEVRKLAGLAAWMAGLMPQMNAFTRILVAAVYSGTEFIVARRQVLLPLQWLTALADMEFGPLERRCRLRSSHYVLITFDGSLSGGGATLQAGVEEFSTAHQRPFVAFWAAAWTNQDLERVRVIRGDPAGQARLEAFTLLNSIYLWRKMLQTAHGKLAIMGDALGVLHDARKFKAQDKVLNEIMAEIALIIAPMGQDVRAAHHWTQRNTTCDLLSRLGEGMHIPTVLSQTPRSTRQVMRYRILSESAPADQSARMYSPDHRTPARHAKKPHTHKGKPSRREQQPVARSREGPCR